MKPKKQQSNIGEEQLAQAQKEAGVYNHPIYEIWSYPYEVHEPVQIFVEAEKFFDARAFGMLLIGVPEVNIRRADGYPLPRWQLSWHGHAAGVVNTLRLHARKIISTKPVQPWLDARDVYL